MNKFIVGLLAISSTFMSAQALARGNDAIYSCNEGEVKLTQFRNRITLESSDFGLCEGHVDIVSSTLGEYKVLGTLGAASCNKALSIEWKDGNGLADANRRIIFLSSKSGVEYIDCHLIQSSKD
jgi:hypothetical protein